MEGAHTRIYGNIKLGFYAIINLGIAFICRLAHKKENTKKGWYKQAKETGEPSTRVDKPSRFVMVNMLRVFASAWIWDG